MKKIAAGIDIGGSNTQIGLVDEQGNSYAETVFSTREYPLEGDYPRYVERLCHELWSLLERTGDEYMLEGVGIGAPDADFRTGRIMQPTNLWLFPHGHEGDPSRRLFPLGRDVRSRLPGVRVAVDNDANAAATGEMVYGGAKGMRDFVMVTLGTGLGSGFVAAGRLIRGHGGMAGELGHVEIEPQGRMCGCGRRGCLEAYVSIGGLRRTACRMMAESTAPSELRRIPPARIDPIVLSNAAARGDGLALEVFRRTGHLLGRTLADMAALTSPEAIFLYGGLARTGELLLEPTRRALDEHLLAHLRGRIGLRLSQLIDRSNVAVLGAAALIWNGEGAATH